MALGTVSSCLCPDGRSQCGGSNFALIRASTDAADITPMSDAGSRGTGDNVQGLSAGSK